MSEDGMTREEAIKQGYIYCCLGCKTVYKEVPREDVGGQSEHLIPMCRCGSDLFMNLVDETMVI